MDEENWCVVGMATERSVSENRGIVAMERKDDTNGFWTW